MLMSATSDEALEAWLTVHPGKLNDTATDKFMAIALWFPLIGVPANDA